MRSTYSLSKWTRSAWPPVAGFATALGLWLLLSTVIGEHTFPPPAVVWDTLWGNLFSSSYLEGIGISRRGYLPHLTFTVRNVFIGLGLGAALGISLGLFSVQFKTLDEIVDTYAIPVVVSPVVVAIPFFFIWFGVLGGAQILLVSFKATFLLYVFSKRAAHNVPPHYVESAQTLGADRWSIFRQVYIPGALPEIAGGLRVALAGAWGLIAIAELIGAQRGLGFLIGFYRGIFNVTGMMALILLLGIVAIAMDRLMVVAIRLFTRWSEAGRALQLR